LLADAGLTSQRFEPSEQHLLLGLGFGLTNAARRTTRGSSELRRRDFAGTQERLREIARELHPLVITFVGKAAYQGTYRERPELGLQERRLAETLLFVLPSTSPANAAVPYEERLRWFVALRELLEPPVRRAARAVVLDEHDRVLLYRFQSPGGRVFWHTPGGGVETGESWEEGLRRELAEEVGFDLRSPVPVVWTREHVFVWYRVVHQIERFFLVHVRAGDTRPTLIDEEGMLEHRWWSLDELDEMTDDRAPFRLPELVRALIEEGPPDEPVDAGV
jgi:ADP-ribose pyrophosphatase YjhB (NUDIX family)/G:T/U-mismatch repair DNA glycosylase